MRLILTIFLLLFAAQSWAGEGRIYAQRVSEAGTAIGSPIEIYSGTSGHTQSRPRVAFYNDRFLVVWQEWNGTDLDVKGARLEMDGTVLDKTPLDIHSGSRNQSLPDVDADTSGWMAVWSSFDGTSVAPSVYAGRIDYDGTINTPLKFGVSGGGISNTGYYPQIAWNSNEGKYLVAFAGLSNYGGANLRWAFLSTTPTVDIKTQLVYFPGAGEAHYPVSMMPGAGNGWSIAIHGDVPGNNPAQGVISIEATGLLNTSGYISHGSNMQRMSSTDLLDNNTHAWGWNGIAADASYAIGVWSRYHLTGPNNRVMYNGDLYAARIDEFDPVESIGGTEIAATSASERNPSIAGDGAGNLLVAYEKDTDGSTEIASKILTVDGRGITPSSEVTLRTDTTGKRRGQIAVAYGDDGGGTTEFLVIWTEGWWGAL